MVMNQGEGTSGYNDNLEVSVFWNDIILSSTHQHQPDLYSHRLNSDIVG